MNHPDPPAPPAPPPEAAAPLPAAAIELGAPYRVPAPPEVPEPELFATPGARRPRPVLGPALSVFAALLWAFVVFGQFTTSWSAGAPLGQTTAVVLVALTTGTAWIASLLRSRDAVPPRGAVYLFWRGLGIAVLAFVLFLVCLVAATAAGGVSSRNHDSLIAMTLVAIAFLAAVAGPRVTRPVGSTRTHRQRVFAVMLWGAGVILTMLAVGDIAFNG